MNITRNENKSNERDCEDIQFQIKEICTTNQYLITYIDSVKKERVEYPKQNTLNFENITKIIVEIDSITAQRKKNGKEVDCQEYRQIPLNGNEENKSIIAGKKMKQNKIK